MSDGVRADLKWLSRNMAEYGGHYNGFRPPEVEVERAHGSLRESDDGGAYRAVNQRIKNAPYRSCED